MWIGVVCSQFTKKTKQKKNKTKERQRKGNKEKKRERATGRRKSEENWQGTPISLFDIVQNQ